MASELIVARHEIRIRDLQRGGNHATHIDLGAGPKQDPVGVDQEDPSICRDSALYMARVRTGYTVKRDRTGTGLNEVDRLSGANAKALPVDDRIGC